MNGAIYARVSSRAVRDPDLHPTSLRLLLVLGLYVNREGHAWPSVRTLCRELQATKPTVTKHIALLAEAGYITVHRRKTEEGADLPNLYTVTDLGDARDFGADHEQEPVRGKAHVLPLGPVEVVKPQGRKPSMESQVRTIFAHWQDRHHHPDAKLNEKRRGKVMARLREGYSVEDIMAAIDGLLLSPWHMGGNPQHTVVDDLDLICRDGSQVEKFKALSQLADDGRRLKLQALTECLKYGPAMVRGWYVELDDNDWREVEDEWRKRSAASSSTT